MALGLVAIGLFLYFIGTWKQKPKEITDKISEYMCVSNCIYVQYLFGESKKSVLF